MMPVRQQSPCTTEDHWHKVFQAEGRTYQEPASLHTGRTKTGCGVGQASAGPFYRPTDKQNLFGHELLYELTTKYKASGDLLPWLTSLTTGHHEQMSWESLANTIVAQQGLSEKERNAIARIELQADLPSRCSACSIHIETFSRYR